MMLCLCTNDVMLCINDVALAQMMLHFVQMKLTFGQMLETFILAAILRLPADIIHHTEDSEACNADD